MYMRTIAFILVIAVLVQVVEMALKKLSFSLYQALGVYLPLITTNCAVLGAAILNSDTWLQPAGEHPERLQRGAGLHLGPAADGRHP